MRNTLRWSARILLVLVLAAAIVGFWQREQITRLLAVNSLFAEDRIVHNFSHMDEAFLTVPVPRGNGATTELGYGAQATLPAQVDQWIVERSVTSLVILKDGNIAHESYHLGTGQDDRRISWSVAKSYLSALMGVLIDEGVIPSLDAPVTQYVPELADGAYDGASIRNVLNMASGVVFDEDYLDPQSDINKMGRVLALGGSMDGFAAARSGTFAAPGTVWQYTSIDTHVLSMVIRAATGEPLAKLLSEKIITPMGLEYAPYYLTDGFGVAFALGGLNLTTRDYARMGQMYLQNGYYNGQQIVPANWVAASTVSSAPTAHDAIGYGYQWWVPQGAPEGEFMARGIYGQYIYINRARGVVIATNAADRKFREAGVSDQNIAMFRSIANSI
ncbi:MAG: serine hydrolase [Sulfitobacter sp.]